MRSGAPPDTRFADQPVEMSLVMSMPTQIQVTTGFVQADGLRPVSLAQGVTLT